MLTFFVVVRLLRYFNIIRQISLKISIFFALFYRSFKYSKRSPICYIHIFSLLLHWLLSPIICIWSSINSRLEIRDEESGNYCSYFIFEIYLMYSHRIIFNALSVHHSVAVSLQSIAMWCKSISLLDLIVRRQSSTLRSNKKKENNAKNRNAIAQNRKNANYVCVCVCRWWNWNSHSR